MPIIWCLIHVLIAVRLLLQLSTLAHAAETSMTFGFSLKSSRHLLEAAKELGLQVVGVSFHIPSSCQDLQEAYTHALSDARCVFDMGVCHQLVIVKLCHRSRSLCAPWPHWTYVGSNFLCNVVLQVDLGFNMNILDIGGGFTGSEFQLREVCFQQIFVFWSFFSNVFLWTWHC